MSTKQKLIVAVLVVLLATMGYFTFARNGAMLPSGAEEDRIAALERKQQEQYDALNQKLDRLADAMAGGRPSAPAGRVDNPASRALMAQLGKGLNGQQSDVKLREIKADLERQFESQPVDSRWSVESTRQVEQALTAEKLKEIGAPPPTATDIDCRSSMCRIHMVYGRSGDASDAAMMLNMEIAKRMPYTRVVSEPRSDGGVDYIVYASQQPTSVRR